MTVNKLLKIGCFSALVSICTYSFAVTNAYSNSSAPLPSSEGYDVESICGATTDWQDVESYDGSLGPSTGFVNENQRAVGQIRRRGRGLCTGTLLADNVLLSAGHCFNGATANGTITDIMDMSVVFDYQRDSNGKIKSGVTFAITQLLEYQLGGLDYAIVQLDGNPNAQFSSASLSTAIPELGDPLTIIQHPLGDPKVVDGGHYDGIEQGGSLNGAMRYVDLDTTGGSTGSGVLDNVGQVIGVDTNAGCTITGGANHGVLNADIEKVSERIAKLADNDRDGLSNWREREIGTNVDLSDTDFDGIDDKWEVENNLDPLSAADAFLDPDNDGYTNLQEYAHGTDPNNAASLPEFNLVAILVPIIGLLLN